jgi:hypothetical protein
MTPGGGVPLPLFGVPTRGGMALRIAAPFAPEEEDVEESERSKTRSFFSMPPVASMRGRAAPGGKATARTM